MLVEANVACCSVPFLFNCMCPNLHYAIVSPWKLGHVCLTDRYLILTCLWWWLQLAMTTLECSGSSYLVRSKTLSSCFFSFLCPWSQASHAKCPLHSHSCFVYHYQKLWIIPGLYISTPMVNVKVADRCLQLKSFTERKVTVSGARLVRVAVVVCVSTHWPLGAAMRQFCTHKMYISLT